MGYSEAAILALKAIQAILLSLENSLAPWAFLCPTNSTINTINNTPSWHYILVGTGSAGSVVAGRLAETGASILVLEEGWCPPYESNMPGYFALQPLTIYDRAMDYYNDGYTCQNLKPEGVVTAGLMLGGTSSIGHMLYIPPNRVDYELWGKAANDNSWAFPEFEKYFGKGEDIRDEGVLAQNSHLHGTKGPAIITKQESPLTSDLIRAHEELGIYYLNDTHGLCTSQPTLYIGNGIRQSGNVAYLSKLRLKSNVHFFSGTVATKIIFKGTTAVGIQFRHNGLTYSATATKQVIISAGALKSPQLLMMSGIGDKDVLADFGIKPVVHNPEVGQNLMDHIAAVSAASLDRNTQPAGPQDPHEWPSPMITAYDALDRNQYQPELQNIALYFGPNSTGLLQLCTYGFKYLNAICDAWYEGNINKNLAFFVINLLHPESRGSVALKSADIKDQLIIKSGFLSNRNDLEKFAKLLLQYIEPLLNTSALQKLGAEFIDLGLCKSYDKFTLDYWKCYIVEMSATMWHFSGTCAMGKVVDAHLNVYGTKNLKVIDASIFPYITSGNIESTVRAVAEKGSDIIKVEDGWST